jgi:hypothetical protein
MRHAARLGPERLHTPCRDGRPDHQCVDATPGEQEQLRCQTVGFIESSVEESEGCTTFSLVTELGPFVELIRCYGRFF